MTFADNLVRLRREKGFSQEQLADLMDVSRQAVSKWEAGQTMPDLPKLVALGGPVRYLTGRVGAAGGRGGNEARRYGAGGDGRTDGVCAGGRDGERCSRL